MPKGVYPRRSGVRLNGDPGRCMVIGCTRNVLYRALQSRVGRGYCADHKHLAVTMKTMENRADGLARQDAWKANHPREDWR